MLVFCLLAQALILSMEVCYRVPPNELNSLFIVNLVPFGPENGDLEVAPGFLTGGQTIDLHLFFPFYGGWYNYTTVSLMLLD